jgi:hypothetical protein
MCCTLQPANLTDTILLAHSLPDGRNVIGYQNKARSLSARPNAMILPFPSATPMSRQNCLDVSKYPWLLKRYAELVRPRERGEQSKGMRPRMLGSVEVFNSGSYTVVLASDARAIPDALEQVPEDKRPRLHPEIFDAYAAWYPGWPIALCCWNGRIEAEPLLWWYEPLPKFREHHFLPGLDAHDGRVPDPAQHVNVDHTIAVGDTLSNRSEHFLDEVDPVMRTFLPNAVYGGSIQRLTPNGDWVLPKLGWTHANAGGRLYAPREKPPGF